MKTKASYFTENTYFIHVQSLYYFTFEQMHNFDDFHKFLICMLSMIRSNYFFKELAIVKCGEIMCHMYIYVLYSMMTALKIKQIIIIFLIVIPRYL